MLPIVLSVVMLVFFTIRFGIERSYPFKIAAITINWLALIVAGILVGVYFKNLSMLYKDNK